MNIEQFDQQIIINEWQLGQQLNTAVHSGTREKFNLLIKLFDIHTKRVFSRLLFNKVLSLSATT